MKNNKLIIDATGANTFGAKYNISSLIKFFDENQLSENRLIVYVSSSFIAPVSKRITIYELSFCRNIFFRILWSTLLLPVVAYFKGGKIIFSPFDIGPFFSIGAKVILGIKNPNIILPKHLVTLRHPILHRTISYLSSFSASRYLFPSRFALESLGKHFPDSLKKGKVVHHGIDLSEWSEQSSNLTLPSRFIYFCSALYKFKNIEVLLHALKTLNLRLIDDEFHLIICGKFVSPEYRDQIQLLINDLGIQKWIQIVENQSRSAIIEYYRNAELIVIPTMFETFGHMYLESIQSGRPVVVADIPVAHEILKTSVLYFPPLDFTFLADLIESKSYLTDHDKRAALGFEIIKSFTIENECKKTFDALFS